MIFIPIQLSPIERYAMRFVEATGAAWTAEQLRAAEAELEAQKREWEANRLAAMHKEEELLKQESEPDEMLTYSRKDSSNQVNSKQDSNSKKRPLGRVNRSNSSQKLSRSVSSHSNSSNSKNRRSAPIRGNRQNSLNSSAPVASGTGTGKKSGVGVSSSSRSSSNNKRPTTGGKGKGTVAATPVQRHTRLHSLGAVSMTNVLTPPTRKTTRTALAASAAASALEDSSLVIEERPKRQSANIAMSKMLKTPLKSNVAPNNSVKTTPPKRGRRDSVSVAATRRKLLERRATIAAPLKHMNDDSEQDEEEEDEQQESEEDTEDEDVDANVDEEEEEESVGSALEEETTQTESQTNDDDDDDDAEEEEADEVEMVDVETEDSEADVRSSSTYGTAGDGTAEEEAESLDGWDAHDQVQDTTMTSSTYYNVSEESDTDEHHEGKAEPKEQPQNSDKSDESEAVGHTPRTRSRGSVKINLWTLDMSPVATMLNRSSANRSVKRTPRTESTPKETQSEPRRKMVQQRVLTKKEDTNSKSNSNVGTLHRWITKSPRVLLRSTPGTAASPSSSPAVSGASGANVSSSGTTR